MAGEIGWVWDPDYRGESTELKRRSRVVGAFPSDQSFMRLGVSILIDINEEWIMTIKYLSKGRVNCRIFAHYHP